MDLHIDALFRGEGVKRYGWKFLRGDVFFLAILGTAGAVDTTGAVGTAGAVVAVPLNSKRGVSPKENPGGEIRLDKPGQHV